MWVLNTGTKYIIFILNITLIYQIVETDIIKHFITCNSEKKDLIFSREMRFQDFEFEF